MRVTVLSSGSGGNCTLVEAPGARVLVDCGLSLRETARRLADVGVDTKDLTAIFLTHEHGDHAGGAPAVSRKLGVPVYATAGTQRTAGVAGELRRTLRAGTAVRVGSLQVKPFAVPHDAAEPVCFVLEEVRLQLGLFDFGVGDLSPTAGRRSHPAPPPGSARESALDAVGEVRARVGIATDLGRPSPSVVRELTGCDVLVVEMNHDEAMLMDGPYPRSLEARVRSPRGHLSNGQGAELLMRATTRRTRRVVLAHLSETNNTPDLARREAERALSARGGDVRLHVALQKQPLLPLDI